MKQRVSRVTFHYMIITGGFWMGFCVVTAYAAVYLQGIGFSNQELGLILALGNVGGAVISPVLGSWIDRNPNIRHANVVRVLLAAEAVVLIALRLNPRANLWSAACYVLYMAVLLPVNAVNLDLCIRLERAGASLAFGVARSMGSFAFVILSTLLGILTEQWSFLILPWAGLAVILLQAAGNRIMDRDLREAEATGGSNAGQRQEQSSSLLTFVKENRSFCLMLFGTILLFMAHNVDGNFLINEIEALGGGTAVMGYVAAFTAIVEMPVMMFSSRLPKKWKTVQYIRAAFVFFVIKMLAYALAPSIPVFFAARIFQAPSYALYTVLIVEYADSVVPARDSAKAQSLAFSMTTIGSVLASLVGGRMFDAVGVKPTMLTAVGIAAVGCAVALMGTFGKKKA